VLLMTNLTLQNLVDDTEQMCCMVGRRVRFQNGEYEITDLLFEEGLIILSADQADDVQEDSYGRPWRLVPKRQNLHFRDAEGRPTSIWEELAFLDGPISG
jgi:hypothetical protein